MVFTRVTTILHRSVGRSVVGKKVEAAMVMEEFEQILQKIFGNKIKKNIVKPLYLRNQELTVAVMSSVLASELQLRSQTIRHQLNQKFSRKVVTRIKFLL